MRELVGREREQGRLSGLLEQTQAGRGMLALIRGEAGIGKTALARWAESEASRRGFATLRGRCHVHGSEVSYGPLVEAYGRVLRDQEADDLAALTDRIGGLSLLFPGLVDEPDLEPVHDELAVTRTLEALRAVLVRLATANPLLLVVDDIQWADSATLRALSHLAGEVEAAPIALLVTMRDGHEAERPDVRTLLTSIRRTCPVDELTPARLDPTETGQVLATLADRPVPPQVVEAVHRRTAGTPLFIESLGSDLLVDEPRPDGNGRGGADRGLTGDPPAAINDAIAERLHELSEDDHDVLAAVAVASATTDLATILRVTQLDDDTFSRSIDRLSARRLVLVGTGPGGAIETAHPLIAEVAERSLSPLERSRLHARFLAVVDAEADPEAAAVHVLGAGDRIPVDRALALLDAAGAQSAARHAYQSTVAHTTAALALVEPLDRPEHELDIRQRLAAGLLGLGQVEAATSVAEDALRLRVDDPAAGLPALCQLEFAAWQTGSGTEELARLDEAVAAVAPDDHRVEVLRALELRLTAHSRRGSAAVADVVEDLGRRMRYASTPPARVMSVVARCYTAELEGRYHGNPALLDQVLAKGTGELPAWLVNRARILRVDSLGHLGPVEELRAAADTIVGDGEGLYVSWRDHIIGYLCRLAALEPDALDLRAVRPHALSGGGSAAWPFPEIVAHRAWLTGDRDALLAVADEVAATRRRFPERIAVVRSAEAVDDLLTLMDGDPERARQRIADLDLAHNQPLLGRDLRETTHRLAALAGNADLARSVEAVLRRGDGGAGWASAQARFLEGRRLALVPDGAGQAKRGSEVSEVSEVLTDAADRLERAGDRLRLARALTILAEATGSIDGRLADLLEPVQQVGLAHLATRMRTVLGASAGPAADRVSAAALTRRQLEIAELVAEGLSNAAIADRLFISVRTVTSHLDHIYTKLNINNRTELAVRLPDLR